MCVLSAILCSQQRRRNETIPRGLSSGAVCCGTDIFGDGAQTEMRGMIFIGCCIIANLSGAHKLYDTMVTPWTGSPKASTLLGRVSERKSLGRQLVEFGVWFGLSYVGEQASGVDERCI